MPTVDRLRSDVDELTRLAGIDLEVLWRQVTDAIIARELLADVLPGLVEVYGTAAGALAADWYDELREEQAVSGRFRAVVAETPPRAQTDAVARWAVEPLFSPDPDHAKALEGAQGALQRLVADVSRETIIGSSLADPQAVGWQRSASGGCAFCQMLASRGAVYSEASVRFGAHDHCRCTAVPAFGGRPLPVQPYRPGSRVVTDADRARTRRWMREHGY